MFQNIKLKIKKTKNKNQKEEYKNKYECMSPRDDIDIKQYNELTHALSNENLLNIGVTGPYGSGKSSVIKSVFKKNNLVKDTIFVSFADFKGKKVKNNNLSDDNGVNISELEKTIIDEICNYDILHRYDKKKLIKNFLIIIGISVLILITLLLRNTITIELSIKNTCLYFIYLIFYSLFVIIILFYINKLNLKFLYKNIEVNINNVDEIFDHNINYLIEILKTLKIKYLVFEDIDRYHDIEIFEKIRNMNTLINLSLENKIKFVYVVSDNLIDNGLNRVKFFDYIYPIIPFVSYSTSGDKAYTRLKELNLIGENGLGRKFIYNTFLYINDYRIVTDIINEYIIYLDTIDDGIKNSDFFDYNSLFAIITYKVLFPDDFSKLEKESEDCILLCIIDCKSLDEMKTKISNIFKDDKILEEKLKEMSEILKLLCYFISSGYISKQTYKMYIKRYYFNEIDINDFNFIQQANMSNFEEKDIDYKLVITHPDIVAERLDDFSYYNISALNYNLLLELLSKKEYEYILNIYIKTILKLKNKYLFLYDFYKLSSKGFNKLLKNIVVEDKDIFNDLINLDNCNYKHDLIFLFLNEFKLLELNIIDDNIEKLIKNIEENSMGLNKEVSDVFINNIEHLSNNGLSYSNLKEIKSKKLLNSIVDNNAYEVNKDNIDFILKEYYKESDKSIKNQPLSLILSSNNSYILFDKNNLIKLYCENNFDLYMDDQDTIKKILSDDNILIESKEYFLQSEKSKIEDISFIIDSKLLDKIVKENRFICNWENIYHYNSKSSSIEILSNFLSSKDGKTIYKKSIPDNIKQDISFIKSIISISNISNDLFDILFNLYNDKYDLLDTYSINKIKINDHKLNKLLNIYIRSNTQEEIYRLKINIINNNIELLSENNVSEILKKIGFEYARMLVNSKRPELAYNYETIELINNLNSKLKYNILYSKQNDDKILIKGSRNKKK